MNTVFSNIANAKITETTLNTFWMELCEPLLPTLSLRGRSLLAENDKIRYNIFVEEIICELLLLS